MAKRVLFQRSRVFLWAMRQALRTGYYTESDPERAQAYRDLAELGKQALYACDAGKQDVMIGKIEFLQDQDRRNAARKEYEDMMNGTHPDAPDWFRSGK